MKGLIPWRKRGEEVMPSRREDNSLDLFEREVSHLFGDFFEDVDREFGGGSLLRRGEKWLRETPSFEVSETDDEFCVKAELPGIDEKDIEVSVEGNELTVRGERKREHEEKKRDYYVSEMSYGEFRRSILLPEGVDRDKAKAEFKKGVLTLTVPKTEEVKAQRKRITVNAA